MTAASVPPTRSCSAVKLPPMAGRTPYTSKNSFDTGIALMNSALSPLTRLIPVGFRQAAIGPMRMWSRKNK